MHRCATIDTHVPPTLALVASLAVCVVGCRDDPTPTPTPDPPATLTQSSSPRSGQPAHRSTRTSKGMATPAARGASSSGAPKSPLKKPDVMFVPTPEPVVAGMLRLAAVGEDDVVYDLGCGDGRIAIAAVRDFGAKKAVCVEIDPAQVRKARANVKRAGVVDEVEVRQADLFETDISEATVVTLYLLEKLNLRLRPRLKSQLRKGARVVSQSFGMGDWEPQETRKITTQRVYLWTIGDAAGGATHGTGGSDEAGG